MDFVQYPQASLKSDDYGKHLLGVQDLIQKHTILEADITSETERCKMLKKQMQKFADDKHPVIAMMLEEMSKVDAACQLMETLSKNRLVKLQESLRVQEFYLQVEEEEAWIREKMPLACSVDYGKDISSVIKLQQKHQTLEADVKGEQQCKNVESLRHCE